MTDLGERRILGQRPATGREGLDDRPATVPRRLHVGEQAEACQDGGQTVPVDAQTPPVDGLPCAGPGEGAKGREARSKGVRQ